MASTLITPRLQIKKDDGLPLSFGLVYTYEAGTTSLLTTYTDSTETTANANPVVLDAGGRASIWLSTTSKYKITITHADGTSLYSEDNISGAGGTLSSVITAGANIDMNGYSIVTNTNQDLPITPNGTGKTKITNLELQSNLDLNEQDILVDNGDAIGDATSLETILQFGSVSSSVNYIKVHNAATGNDVKLEVLGTDDNVGLTLLTLGTGTVNVAGTTNYEEALTSDDDLVNKKYVDDLITTTIATTGESGDSTNTINLMTPNNLSKGQGVAGAWGVVTFSGSTPTLGGSYNVTSITDQGVGDIDFNLTTAINFSTVIASCEDDNSVAHQISGGSSTVISIGLYDIDGAAAIDTNFSMVNLGGQT